MKIKLLSPNAKLPTLGSPFSAGYDLYAAKACAIEPGQSVSVPTDISIEIPEGFWGGIYARSGMAVKRGLRPANAVGVIDSDYRGNIMVALYNDSDIIQEISAGDRIAQLIFHQRISITPDPNGEIWQVVDELSDTERGSGGFGSTGSN